MPFKSLAVALVALFLAACNPMAQLDGATEEIDRFHATFNSGDSRALYNRTGEEFREVTTESDMEGLVSYVTEFMGKVESTEREGFNINTNNGVTSTVVTMKTTYEKGEATETFTFRGTGDDMRIIGWNVDSPNFRAVPEQADNGAGPEEVAAE